jgi:hypothetical protein
LFYHAEWILFIQGDKMKKLTMLFWAAFLFISGSALLA